jgi:ribosome-associated protein
MIKDKEKYNKQLVDVIVEGMQEVKGQDIVCLDLREIPNSVTDYFIVCHGDSNTQVSAIAKSVEKETREKLQDKPFHKEGVNNSEWVLLDYVNVVVHVFYRETREFYDIEGLWADAKITKIEYQV